MNRTEETDKLMQVLEAVEHPERYSDEQLRQLLDDQECRDYYHLMCDLTSACAGTKAEADVDVDAEWQRFCRKNYPVRSYWRIIAAVFMGILMMSGLSYAAVGYFIGQTDSQSSDVEDQKSKVISQQSAPQIAEPFDTVCTFQDAELQEILSQLADYYQLHAEYRNEQARHIRLYIKWNKMEDAQAMIDRLNRFEKVNVTLTNGLITAE